MVSSPTLRAGMIGMGMIFDETYRPFFERAHREGVKAGIHCSTARTADTWVPAFAGTTGGLRGNAAVRVQLQRIPNNWAVRLTPS